MRKRWLVGIGLCGACAEGGLGRLDPSTGSDEAGTAAASEDAGGSADDGDDDGGPGPGPGGDDATSGDPDGGPGPQDGSDGDATGEDDGTAGPADTGDTGSEPGDPVVVAVGATHARYVSLDDGVTWCQVARTEDPAGQDFDTPFLLRNVTYANGTFVTGSWEAIFASPNGLEWEDVTQGGGPAAGQWIAQIDWGNGWWVATGGYGSAMRSRDLFAWENTTEGMPGTEASRMLAFGDGVFVTARDDVGWFQSSDGTAWTQMDASAGTSVVFDGADFVEHPGFDAQGDTRLRGAWPDAIERAVGDGPFETVATVQDSVTRIAFGQAPTGSIAAARIPDDLAACLGL
jgi:hypothetical protein